ncbi:MAG: methyltransferase domain-containing protein [Gemmatimonadaceae bacterium]
MPSLLTPPRVRGIEYLDDPTMSAEIQRRSLADVARANHLLGGSSAVIAELVPALNRMKGRGGTREATLLDVGTGIGDIPARAREVAAAHGVRLTTVGLDGSEALVAAARARAGIAVRGCATRLPFPDHSVEFVTCSQVVHHFDDRKAADVIRELDRVARGRVIISDIRRSWAAAAGIWMVSFPLGFHAVSRHDGVVSVMRGFTAPELRDLIHDVIGFHPVVCERRGFRITASWTPVWEGRRAA